MSWFDKKKNNDPVPKGVKLIGDAGEWQELAIDRLTAEILRQDLEFIRSFYQKLSVLLNEKLSLLDAVSRGQQTLDVLINKFGKTQDQMLSANLGVLTEIKNSNAEQNANHAQTINTLLGVIESLNTMIESQNRMLAGAGNHRAGGVPAPAQIKLIELAEKSEIETRIVSGESNRNEESGAAPPVETVKQNAARDGSENLRADDEFAPENKTSNTQIDTEEFSRRLLDDIRQKVLSAFGKDAAHEVRNADHIPGFQCHGIWFLALPPKSDGKYDSTVLQDSAFKKIKLCLSKNKEEKIIAVYHGEIGEKKLAGARKMALDYKIQLTHFFEINKVLARVITIKTETPAK